MGGHGGDRIMTTDPRIGRAGPGTAWGGCAFRTCASCGATPALPLPRSPPWRWASEPTPPSSPWSTRCCSSRSPIPTPIAWSSFWRRRRSLPTTLPAFPSFTSFSGRPAYFKEVAAYDNAGPGFNLTGDRPEQVHGIHVTEGYFRVYGAPDPAGTDLHAAGGLAPRRQGRGSELRPVAAQVRRRSGHRGKVAFRWAMSRTPSSA